MNHSLKEVKNSSFGIILLFTIVAFVIYFPSLNAEPLWDDWYYIFKSWTINHVGFLEYWKWGPYKRSWPLFYSACSIMLKYWKSEYLLYHLTSLILHVTNSFFIYKLIKKIKGNYPLLLSLIYLVHPLQLFNVIWIIQIKTLMAIFFFLIAFYFFLESERESKGWKIVPSFLFYSFSLFSKSSFLPIVLLFPFYRKKIKLVPFFLVSLYSTGLTIWSSHLGGFIEGLQKKITSLFFESALAAEKITSMRPPPIIIDPIHTPFDSLILSLVNLTKYSWYVVFPWKNLLVHPTTKISNNFFEMTGFTILFLIVVSFIIKAFQDKNKGFMAGIFFYLITLMPFCGIILIPIFQYSNFVEYWLAVPFLGIILAVSMSNYRFNTFIALSVMLMFFSGKTFFSVRENSNPIAIINNSAADSPKNVLIPLILSKHYFYKGEYSKSNEILLKYKKDFKRDIDKIDLEIEANLRGIKGEEVNDYAL